MAFLAEELVEEWLNRNGFFTIRGIKVGVHEIDLLAVGFKDGEIICRHIEVQASARPIGYISGIPIKKSSSPVLSEGVEKWVFKKYRLAEKERLRNELYLGNWTFELVVNQVRHENELKLIEEHGILIHRLDDIVSELSSSKTIVTGASGSDLLELILLGKTKS